MLAFKRGERRLLRGGEADAERRAKPKAAKRTCAAGSMTERREGHLIRQPTVASFSKEKEKRREQAHRPTRMCGGGEAQGRDFLVLADMISRVIVAPEELPIGVVSAFFGAPFFLYLIRKSHGKFGG